jgi:hypothetical protein
MPAHIGIGDQLNWGLGVALQGASGGVLRAVARIGFQDAAATAYLRENLAKTTKGRSVLNRGEDGDYDSDMTWSEAKNLLERQRNKREIHCDSYAVYRSRLNEFKSAGAGSFPKKSYGVALSIVKLTSSEGYHEKDHEDFKEEWTLYLSPDTYFDGCVKQFFNEGWVVTLIKGRDRHVEQLKRIEASKKGKAVKLLWTAA